MLLWKNSGVFLGRTPGKLKEFYLHFLWLPCIIHSAFKLISQKIIIFSNHPEILLIISHMNKFSADKLLYWSVFHTVKWVGVGQKRSACIQVY